MLFGIPSANAVLLFVVHKNFTKTEKMYSGLKISRVKNQQRLYLTESTVLAVSSFKVTSGFRSRTGSKVRSALHYRDLHIKLK